MTRMTRSPFCSTITLPPRFITLDWLSAAIAAGTVAEMINKVRAMQVMDLKTENGFSAFNIVILSVFGIW